MATRNREQVETMIKIAKIMGHTPGDPTRCGCTVRVGGGPNSRSVRYHKCRRPVAVVDVDDNGWCAQHATADRTVICDHCHMTAAQGCACEDAAEYGIAI